MFHTPRNPKPRKPRTALVIIIIISSIRNLYDIMYFCRGGKGRSWGGHSTLLFALQNVYEPQLKTKQKQKTKAKTKQNKTKKQKQSKAKQNKNILSTLLVCVHVESCISYHFFPLDNSFSVTPKSRSNCIPIMSSKRPTLSPIIFPLK